MTLAGAADIAPENIHRSATAVSRLLLLLRFRRLPLRRLLTTLSALLTAALVTAPLRLRSRNSCEVCGGIRLDCAHRGSWQSTRSRESLIHLPWQVEFVARPRRLSPPAMSADSFHLPIPTYLSRLSLLGRSTQISEPATILITYRFCFRSTVCKYNCTPFCSTVRTL